MSDDVKPTTKSDLHGSYREIMNSQVALVVCSITHAILT